MTIKTIAAKITATFIPPSNQTNLNITDITIHKRINIPHQSAIGSPDHHPPHQKIIIRTIIAVIITHHRITYLLYFICINDYIKLEQPYIVSPLPYTVYGRCITDIFLVS